jgi:hypothetical protein
MGELCTSPQEDIGEGIRLVGVASLSFCLSLSFSLSLPGIETRVCLSAEL